MVPRGYHRTPIQTEINPKQGERAEREQDEARRVPDSHQSMNRFTSSL
jgi:hypothetical protein